MMKFKIIFIFLVLICVSNILSLEIRNSNESLEARDLLINAEQDILDMVERGIPVERVNESYQEALQIYSAQLALEDKGINAEYKIIKETSVEIKEIRALAIEAKDELTLFKTAFEEASIETDLSEMQEDYDEIVQSFQDERFEDTLKLIEIGYKTISEIESSQTVLRAFYASTSQTIRNFFVNQGLKIVTGLVIILVLGFIFRGTLEKIRVKQRLNYLRIQKMSINDLIKKSQKEYFKTRKMSEGEFNVKLKKFKEMIRDIDREIMVLKEEKIKREVNKKS